MSGCRGDIVTLACQGNDRIQIQAILHGQSDTCMYDPDKCSVLWTAPVAKVESRPQRDTNTEWNTTGTSVINLSRVNTETRINQAGFQNRDTVQNELSSEDGPPRTIHEPNTTSTNNIRQTNGPPRTIHEPNTTNTNNIQQTNGLLRTIHESNTTSTNNIQQTNGPPRTIYEPNTTNTNNIQQTNESRIDNGSNVAMRARKENTPAIVESHPCNGNLSCHWLIPNVTLGQCGSSTFSQVTYTCNAGEYKSFKCLILAFVKMK